MNKSPKLSRRQFLNMAALASVGAAGMALAPSILAQTPEATPAVTATAAPAATPLPNAPAAGPLTAEAAGGMDALVAAANKEAALSVIALPDDWADYKDMKANFKAKYPDIAAGFQDLNPDGSSAQEISAIQANAGNTGPQNPDVIDVGFHWGADAKAAGLLQPYKVATWDTIPDSLKDADGYWYGDYYGKIAFEVNADQVTNVPQDWSDLLKPEYKGLIALPSDPSTAAEAAYVVWLAALANGGSLDDPTAGMQFFKKLVESGNLILTRATAATVSRGDTPITLRWDYNALADRDANAANTNVTVAYPTSGTIAGVYVQAISAYAPRPNAARVWMEYLYSDEGQLVWYKGYATPVRYDDLSKRGVVPADLMSKFPKADVPVALPTLDQVNKALATINAQWNTIVGVAISSS